MAENWDEGALMEAFAACADALADAQAALRRATDSALDALSAAGDLADAMAAHPDARVRRDALHSHTHLLVSTLAHTTSVVRSIEEGIPGR